MTDKARGALMMAAAALSAVVLVIILDLLTNSISLEAFSWDSRYYFEMGERGFAAQLASPFAYRYVTPLLARGLSAALGLPTASAFVLIAYAGAIGQLLGVYLLTRWYAKSEWGAWLAMLVTAFSLYNIKFLLFDAFRPDHLAYPLILLQTYLALTGRFWPLLAATIVGWQIREFNAAPLLAYLYASRYTVSELSPGREGHRRLLEVVVSIVALGLAIVLPRVLLPTAEDFQFANLTRDGLLRVALAPFILARDANYLFSVVAYILPLLMLAGPRQLLQLAGTISQPDRAFLGAYCVLVLAFSFLGGTDFFRFSTYLFLPQSILIGLLARKIPLWRQALVLGATIVFNRIWLPIPNSNVADYLDFYGAYGTRFNRASLLRIAECAGFLAAGTLVRKLHAQGTSLPVRA